MDWSSDGKFLLYAQVNGGIFDLWALPLSEPRKPFLVGPPFDKPDAQFSPDVRWVAYTSNESGRYEVYLKPFHASGGEEAAKWQVSGDGGRAPRWRADRKELYYLSSDNHLKAVKVQLPPGGAPSTSTPQELFTADIPGNFGANIVPYDVSPDGQLFLLEEYSAVQASSPLIVHVNWQAAIGR